MDLRNLLFPNDTEEGQTVTSITPDFLLSSGHGVLHRDVLFANLGIASGQGDEDVFAVILS